MIKSNKILVFILILFLMTPGIRAEKTGIQTARRIAHDFLVSQQKQDFTLGKTRLLFQKDEPVGNAYLITLKPTGFIIVSDYTTLSPVLAYSFDNPFESDGDSEITEIGKGLIKDIIYHDKFEFNHSTAQANKQTDIYGPYVHTMWGQVNCHDINGQLINVTNLFTPNHCAVGCVAISQATVMHHYRWPPKGVGSHTYSDNSGSNTGTYSVNFGETEYKMNLAKERYRGKASTMEEREAAGEIAFHCAVSVNMNFENNGSTSNINRIPYAYAHYFRFTSLYRQRSSTTFWSLLDSNMVYKKPAILAVKNSSGGGHSVVCDGLKIDENLIRYYHLNMGWWGTSNGWYKIRGSFNAGGYNYVTGAVMNIIPEPMIIPPVIWEDSVEFDLKWRYPAKAEAEAFQVQKSVDGGDWITITDELTDTTIHLVADPEKTYKFRVRAKTNGKWYQNSWSTVEELKRQYLSIDDQPENSFSIYPNPFNDRFSIQSSGLNNEILLSVFNLSGQKVYEQKFNNQEKITINSSFFDKGLYFIKITGDKTFVIKAVKN